MLLKPKIETLTAFHYPEVANIYRQGIQTGKATFESTIPSWPEWNKKMLPHCRLILSVEDKVAGWSALAPVSTREVYKGVAEVSIYISEHFRGLGLGKQLLDALISESEQNGVWTLQASIFAENIQSIRMHQACGFRIVGIREKIGRLQGKWKDNVLMERRSPLF